MSAHHRAPKPLILVAMGGNSLLDPTHEPTVGNQFGETAKAVIPMADLTERGVRMVVTHGNGPQVGFMLLRSESAKSVIHPGPLDSIVADSQGAIGYMIQLQLREEMRRRGHERQVVSLVTEVEVDPHDRAFTEPTKPVGKFYSEAEAEEIRQKHGWIMVEDAHRGYRRVVSSPSPVRIVEMGSIRTLLEHGVITICCGGGGIPVIKDEQGHLTGIEAVIDKDRVSALLAVKLGVERMFITTGTDAIYVHYRTLEQRALENVTCADLKRYAAEGHFPPGSMGPKVEAAIYFLERGGKEVVICTPEHLADAYDGKAGTRILAS
jgi:carbamate kinase